MPIYEYECERHGAFQLLRRSSEHRSPTECPGCTRPARRILSQPALPALPSAVRVARERNEGSAHEPRVAPHPASAPRSGPPAPAAKRHSHRHGRPWMLGHG